MVVYDDDDADAAAADDDDDDDDDNDDAVHSMFIYSLPFRSPLSNPLYPG